MASSFINQSNPRANVFIFVNLGCEMLYVIDQRLKAQQIAEEKSIQVMHDIINVLLETKFIDSLMRGSVHSNAQLFKVNQCKFMLKDVATCSLMRLDEASMDKLWNLMTMIYKWQLFVTKHQVHLLDITIRHLDTVSKLYPDFKCNMLIDYTKNTLLDFWNNCGEEGQLSIYHTNIAWVQCFNTKISLLIRLGFQSNDGLLLRDVPEEYFEEFVDSIGDNIYVKSTEIVRQPRDIGSTKGSTTNRIDQLAELLNFQQTFCDDLKPINPTQFQKQFEKNLQQCNILFEDLDVNKIKETSNIISPFDGINSHESGEFVQLKPIYNRSSEITSTVGNKAGNATINGSNFSLDKKLLNLYSEMN
ncbi:uncharacterized protein LOC119685438 [Teleopsis dalmanni]|uniref:uncharacterized protein LOC119674457 n=1 Tax=Teleopsis dalmanni TaxID=139649 RepID=UPI0018CFB6F3|nr:uncharacterized protein LOC119674457 [Teleopsis dalmanni]XP_037955641.1 uncharacterized protein LOC119685438 [Teleopsis dalmanni]